MLRELVPAETRRAVLVEAGHRCAIPTCRATTTEVAHIIPWAETQDNSFENLIALCPNCHTRFDQKKEMDRKAMQMYKVNLGLVNHRYSEFERRIFFHLAETGCEYFLVGAGADILLLNAVKDGLIRAIPVNHGAFEVRRRSDGRSWSFPMTHTYEVTAKGRDFVRRFKHGENLP